MSLAACQGTGEIPGEGGGFVTSNCPRQRVTLGWCRWLCGDISMSLVALLGMSLGTGAGVSSPRDAQRQGTAQVTSGGWDTRHLSQGGTFGDMVGAGVTTAMAMMLRRDVTWVSPWGTLSARLLRPHPSNEHHLWGAPLWGQSSCVPSPLPGLTGTHSALSPWFHPCHPRPWLG